MSRAGFLGAVQGAGAGIAEVGKMLTMDQLETMRQEKLDKLQGAREEKKQVFTAGESEKDRTSKATEGVLSREATASEGALDRASREKIAEASAKAAKDKAAADAGGKETSQYQQWLDLTSGRLGAKYPDDWAVGIAYGGHKTTTDPRTKEMILLGPDSKDPSGFKEVGRMQPEDPAKRRGPKVWEPKVSDETGGMLNQPGPAAKIAAPDPVKYAKVSGDYSKYADGDYNNGKVKVVNGVAYKLK